MRDGPRRQYVRFNGNVSDAQVAWGSCADPRGLLQEGKVYELARVEQHSFHTKLFLEGIDCGRGFNDVNFTYLGDRRRS